MNILVIGGAGYIGSHVLLELISAGHTITVFDNLSSGFAKSTPQPSRLIQGDILDTKALNEAMQEQDAVIHLAALKAAGESSQKIADYASNNITGSINILNAMLANGVGSIVFSSTAAVYGYPDKCPVVEDAATRPINFYGFTKLKIEELLGWYSAAKNIRFAALRYFNVAGYDPDGRIRDLEKSPNNLLPIIMENLTGTRTRFEYFGDDYSTPDGTCIRDYIHVTDLSQAHSLALQYIIREGKDLTVNLGTSKGLSVKQIVNAALELDKGTINCVVSPRRMGDPDMLICDYSRAKRLLDWTPKNSTASVMLQTMAKVYGL